MSTMSALIQSENGRLTLSTFRLVILLIASGDM